VGLPGGGKAWPALQPAQCSARQPGRPPALTHAQLRRVAARDGAGEAAAAARVAAQMPLAAKLRAADYVIDNNGSLQDLEAAVAALAPRLRPAGGAARGLLTSPLGLLALGAAARAWGPRLLAVLRGAAAAR
jgi:hypothetical protein